MAKLHLTLSEFFSLPCRTQIVFIENIARDSSTLTNQKVNGYEFAWSNLEEIMATFTELFVSANTDPKKRTGEGFKFKRPYGSPIKEISPEKQAQINEMLTPIF